MNEIVVYDLNETLYLKSSKEEFFKFICYKKEYKLANLFQLGWITVLKKLKLIGKTYYKENFYSYLNNLPPETVKKYSKEFWSIEFPQHFNKEMIKQVDSFDKEGKMVLIITGSLEVYTKFLEELMPLKVYGTRTEYVNNDYKVIGEACNGEVKIQRLNEVVKENYRLLEAYSDQKEEILFHAEKGYYVEEEKVTLIHEEGPKT